MLGQNPVAFETFDEDVARNLGDTTTQGDGSVNATGTDTATPSGVGGSANQEGLGGSA
jgi:hypothetical protein